MFARTVTQDFTFDMNTVTPEQALRFHDMAVVAGVRVVDSTQAGTVVLVRFAGKQDAWNRLTAMARLAGDLVFTPTAA